MLSLNMYSYSIYSFFVGFNFLQLAVHELGHSLGLGHSSVYDSVMTASYYGYKSDFKLDKDDIEGIQSLYGKPVTV